jgi:spore coat polysaccharide biosynthesis protein SpsF
MNSKVGVVVAARTASTRLPNKALMPLLNLPMVLFLLRRLRYVRDARVVLATTTLSSDDELCSLVERENISVYRGSPSDLVQRYCDIASKYEFETIVRITADCPFVDSELVNWCLEQASSLENYDLATTKGRFPVGLDVEIFSAKLMEQLNQNPALTVEDREHLTLFCYRHNYKIARLSTPANWPKTTESFTVDTFDDYQNANGIVNRLGSNDFSVLQLLSRS